MIGDSYKPSDAPVTAKRGFDPDALTERSAFAADVTQENSFTLQCGDTFWIMAARRSGNVSGGLQIILGDMANIPEGLAIMRHLMGIQSTTSIVTWVNEHEPLHNANPLVIGGIRRKLDAEGWSLTIDGHIWLMERI